MAYSAVTHPLFWPRRKAGTFSSTDTVQITLVSPISINTDPSAYLMKLRVILTGRSSSGRRPSTRTNADPLMASHYTRPLARAQFSRRYASQQQRTQIIAATGAGFNLVPLVDSPEKPVLELPTFMLDPRLTREYLKEVRTRLGPRAQDIDWDGLHKLDQERRDLLTKVEELRHKRKTVSDQIAKLKRDNRPVEALMEEMRGVGDRLKSLEDSLRDAEDRLNTLSLRIPNIPHPSVPIGADSSANQEIRCWGKPPTLAFPPKHHWELGESLGVLDFERAARMTGARFAVYIGAGARLERALINFMLDLHTAEHGYQEILPPFLVNRASMTGTGQLPKFEDDLFRLRAKQAPTGRIPAASSGSTSSTRSSWSCSAVRNTPMMTWSV